jgi:hypothetical protein
MNDFKILRDAILAIAGTQIGTYLIGTESRPAIMVIPPQPKAGWQVQGLEVIIRRNPESKSHGTLGGERRELNWSIILNQWDKADRDTLRAVSDRIKLAFAPVISSYQDQTKTTYERSNLYIPVSYYHRRK